MKLEALVRWSELKFKESDSTQDYLDRIIGDGEQQQAPKATISYDYSPMVFDTDDISRFNRSNDPEFTTLRFKDGDGYVIKYPYLEFRDLYSQLGGRAIVSITGEDKEEESDEDDLIL